MNKRNKYILSLSIAALLMLNCNITAFAQTNAEAIEPHIKHLMDIT